MVIHWYWRISFFQAQSNPLWHKKEPTISREKIQKDGFIRDNFLTHLNEPRSGINGNKLSLGGKALIFLGLLPSLSIKDSDLICCGGEKKKENRNATQEAKREPRPMVNFLSGVSAMGESLTNLVRGNTTSHEDDPGIGIGKEVIGTPKKKKHSKTRF